MIILAMHYFGVSYYVSMDVRTMRLTYVVHWFFGKQNEGDISHWGYMKKRSK